MERTIGIERTYLIEPFNTIKLLESFVSVPEEVAKNDAVVNKIKLLLLLDVELTFRKYLMLKEKLDQLPIEDGVTKLEELSTTILGEIRELLETKEV